MSAALDQALSGLMEALSEVDAANRASHKLIREMRDDEAAHYIFETQYNLCLRATLMVIPDIDAAGRIVSAFLMSLMDLKEKNAPAPKRKKH